MKIREVLDLIDSLKNELPLTISEADVRVPTFTLRGKRGLVQELVTTAV